MRHHQHEVVLPPVTAELAQTWHLLFDLQEMAPGAWTLIGGLMVALHGLEHGRSDSRPHR